MGCLCCDSCQQVAVWIVSAMTVVNSWQYGLSAVMIVNKWQYGLSAVTVVTRWQYELSLL